jgi:hypothetical protein
MSADHELLADQRATEVVEIAVSTKTVDKLWICPNRRGMRNWLAPQESALAKN